MALAAMPPRLLAGARGRLLMFNLLVVAVTLMVSSVAIIGFHHAGTIQEQAQERTLDDMTGSPGAGARYGHTVSVPVNPRPH